ALAPARAELSSWRRATLGISPAGDEPRPGPAGNRLQPGLHLRVSVGGATPPGADTARPPTTVPRSPPRAQRPRLLPTGRPQAAPPGQMPPPTRRDNRIALAYVPRLAAPPAPGGCAPHLRPPRPASPAPIPAGCVPARRGAPSLARWQRRSTRPHGRRW